MGEKQRIESEVAAILAQRPSLGDLIGRPRSNQVATPVVLCRTAPIFFAIPIHLPELPGKLFVGRLPGRVPHAQRDVDGIANHGITDVFCLVPHRQLVELHGADQYLSVAQEKWGERFLMVDIDDHKIPMEDSIFDEAVERLFEALKDGRSVYVHCVGGCGRTGMLVSALFIRLGMEAVAAITRFRNERSCGPETNEQVAYVVRYQKNRPPHSKTLAKKVDEGVPPPASGQLTPTAQARLTVRLDENGQPKELSRGGLALIGTGRLKFPDGRSRRVAVKYFRYPVTEQDAIKTQKCVDALRAAGVALPKMSVFSHDGRWVLLSPLYGSWKQGSKLSQPNDLIQTLNDEEQDFVVQQLTRVALAGYLPSLDLFLQFRHKKIGLIPLDLDLIDEESCVDKRAKELVKRLIQVGSHPKKRDALANIVNRECRSNGAGPLLWEKFEPLTQPGTPYRAIWDGL